MKDLWPEDIGPFIRYEPDDPALLALPPPKPDNPFDCIAPEKLFAAGVDAYCVLAWQSDRTRERVRWLMQTYGHSVAEALDDLYWLGGL